jgi:hypothetical protein
MLQIGQIPFRVLCFDSEPDAQRRAHELARQLQAFPGETIVVKLETGKDPNSADPTEIKQLRERYLR